MTRGNGEQPQGGRSAADPTALSVFHIFDCTHNPCLCRPTVRLGHRHGCWRVIDRLPWGEPVWGRVRLGVVWPWSQVLIGNGWPQMPDVNVSASSSDRLDPERSS
jgi:hypothetical protein